MRVSPPRLRAPNALSASPKRQILFHMENFPTPNLAMVPRVANLLTLVFLVGTTWWSGAQRPPAQEAAASAAAPKVVQAANKPSQLPLDNAAPAPRISSNAPISAEGLITVGFNATSLR